MCESREPELSPPSHGRFRKLLHEFRRDPKSAFVGTLFHDRLSPKLIEFQRGATLQSITPEELLGPLLGRPVSPQLRAEFAELQASLAERYRRPLPFPTVTQLSDPQSFLLYALVRELRPATVFETGVANGHSSYVFLRALEKNQSGTLWSVDISNQVGALVDPGERARWKLRILPLRGERAAFRSLLKEVGPIDLFEHDSDHSYAWQKFEMESVWPQLRSGAMLSVDDADWSWASLDFARDAHVGLSMLVTTTRVCAVFKHP